MERDHTARNDELGPEEEIADDLKDRMRRVICGWASRTGLQTADAVEMMQALGVHPQTKVPEFSTTLAQSINSGPGHRINA